AGVGHADGHLARRQVLTAQRAEVDGDVVPVLLDVQGAELVRDRGHFSFLSLLGSAGIPGGCDGSREGRRRSWVRHGPLASRATPGRWSEARLPRIWLSRGSMPVVARM